MVLDDRALRALSFGAIAEDYDRYRPGPPTEAVEWLLPQHCDSVVDIGAGTGALSRLLVGRARRVVAVEPDPRMLAVLATRVPDGRVVAGRAEELPVDREVFDAVVGSSMWHWVDAPRAAFEAARVLRPGGVLGLLWSGPDRSEGWLADVLARTGRRELVEQDADARRHRHQLELPVDAPFGVPETHRLQWSLTVTPDQLIGLAGTYSGFIVRPDAERAQLRDDLTAAVRDHPAIAGRDTIELPMRCICWRAIRLA